ncbi:NAD(P)-binding domain-containing protein, partial [Candidatus Saccharibacteria bacterium]|nr:NAD(P)-binding domain-containing protein [Candidatus Saccharibacteria bacterium]NIV03735.1 NAD(P)-binding domain-containing protein [Calditrichia bacterium]NIV72603.1 NAD(P)-binding domain-containing protein [Calditrichia bacterium]NIV98875.1 NAD(P)-binding domain-containing protein [Candidatus Saccharibacteria bacterium]NIW79503.1 NAD(P)-binding domain-containing protein [Calditrichia bacterium]
YFELVIAGGENVFARRVIIGIGRSGNFRKLNVPGEDKDKVYNRLHDPKDFCDQEVLVVGGGDSALEAAIALAQCGGRVTLSYRKAEFSRPKPENIESLQKIAENPYADVAVETPTSERITTSAGGYLMEHKKPGKINLMMNSQVKQIDDDKVTLIDEKKQEVNLPNDAVFAMIGREAPLDFFRRSGVRIKGEMRAKQWITFILFVLFCAFVYNWKGGGSLTQLFQENGWFPYNMPNVWNDLGASISAMA